MERRQRSRETRDADRAAHGERGAHLLQPSATNGRLIAGSRTASGTPVALDSSIETPVTPPSMKLLERRKPLIPIAAERMPSAMNNGVHQLRGECGS